MGRLWCTTFVGLVSALYVACGARNESESVMSQQYERSDALPKVQYPPLDPSELAPSPDTHECDKAQRSSATAWLYSDEAVSFFRAMGETRDSPTHISIPPAGYDQVIDCGADIVPELVNMLEGDVPEVRAGAFDALVGITNEAFGDFDTFLAPEHGDKRQEAVRQWREWWRWASGKPTSEWFMEDLVHGDRSAKIRAISKLERIGGPGEIDALRQALHDPDVAMQAAHSLALLGDISAMPFLIELYLDDESESIREEGIQLARRLSRQDFGFRADGSESDREIAIRKWAEWWIAYSKTLQQ